MESYAKILMASGKANSLGRAQEVIDNIYVEPSRLAELFDCISADDAWVRMRAIDSFEKIIKERPDWVQPYLDRVFSDLTQSNQPSVQWHLAQIFPEVKLTDKQRNEAITWLENRIKTTDVDWIVSVNTMKALLYFQQDGFVTADELKQLFQVQERHKSKSVRKKAESFQQKL